MAGRHRGARLNELFRRELSRLLLSEIKDPRVEGCRVTEVRVTNDLSYATVYVTFDSESSAADVLEGLHNAAGFMRHALGQSLHLRKIPEFRFVEDETLERAGRIEELLREAREDQAGDS